MASFKRWLESSASKLRPAGGIRVYILIAALVLGGGMIMSYLVALNQSRINRQQGGAALTGGLTYLERTLGQRLSSYEEILRSGASLSRIAGGMSQTQWREFVKDLEAERRYPGTRALAYAAYVAQAELSAHVAQVRSSGDADYEVKPTGSRALYVPVVFAELIDPAESAQTLGFDVYSDPIRRAALIAARDSGETAITDPTVLRSDLDEPIQPSAAVVYHPVYEGVNQPSSTAARRSRIVGYTFAVFRIEDLLVGLFGREALNNPNAALQLRTTAKDESVEIYSSPAFQRLAGQGGTQRQSLPLTVFDKTWEATVVVATNAAGAWIQKPGVIFMGGSLVSLLLAALIFMLMINRLIRTVVSQELQVQLAREELLSLASHQLRTPASGVKQYVGMILQGYSGKLNKEQESLLQKAYNANERQLETINQLLYVAKADAGQIRLEKSRHNLTKLVQDVLDNFQDEATTKNINLIFRRTRPLDIKGDPRLIRMIVENLVSNAIKYSYPKNPIRLNLSTQGARAILSVKDKGVGIAKTDQDRLFHKFSRITNEFTGEAGGSGLGLFLAQKLAAAHGGSVKVSSDQGAGAIFTLKLPGLANARKRA